MEPENSPQADSKKASLTPMELRDLALAAEASPAEGLYLSEELEEAGIPVVEQEQPPMPMGFAPVRLCVPRKLLAEAQRVIAAAREKARAEGITQAFEPDSICEATYDKDPVMLEMFSLREAEPDKRESILKQKIADWVVEGTSEIQIAQYLAAAGLTETEAREFAAAATKEKENEIQSRRSECWVWGWGMLILGICLTVFSNLAHLMAGRIHYFKIFSGLIITGLFFIYRGSSRKTKIF